jgi:hypothetical protein
MKRTLLIVIISLVFMTACGPKPIPVASPGSLLVDPDIDLGPISPLIYGSNHGPWTAVPAGMMDFALDSRVTNLRWPGGEWGDNFDVKEYQIDQFMFFLEQLNAIPTISVRMVDGTPEAAAELVRYCNIEKGYDVKYWSIGNEPTLYEGRPAVDSFDTVRFNREWRAIAEAMKAVDPDILLLGPELHGSYTSNFAANPKDSSGRDWMVEFLEANGDMVDIVTYHRYPFPGSSGSSAKIPDLRQDLPEWNRTIRYLRELIQETTGRDLPIGVTETNSHYTHAVQGEATPDSLYNAIWWADALGRMIDEDVFIANYFLLAATGSSAGFGMIAPYDIRPTYYVYQLYSHFGDQQIYASSGVAGLNMYAARDSAGRLTIMIINPEDTALNASLEVVGLKARPAEKWLLDATHNAENLGMQTLTLEGELAFPGQSVTLYIIAP